MAGKLCFCNSLMIWFPIFLCLHMQRGETPGAFLMSLQKVTLGGRMHFQFVLPVFLLAKVEELNG